MRCLEENWPTMRLPEVLQRALRARLGFELQPHLHSRVVQAAARLVDNGAVIDVTELASRLAYLPDGDPLVQEMVRAACVGETFFLRASAQLQKLCEVAGQRLLANRAKRTLRIWSAGCSTGEEAYSLAALFSAAYPAVELRVVGTDVNERSLAWARRGIYELRALRAKAKPGWLIARDGRLHVDERLKAQVEFRKLNLACDRLGETELGAAFDVVVCRYVLMYFAPDLVLGVLRRLTCAMARPSLLLLAPPEYPFVQNLAGLAHVGHGVFLHPEPARPEVTSAEARRGDERSAPPRPRPQTPAGDVAVGAKPSIRLAASVTSAHEARAVTSAPDARVKETPRPSPSLPPRPEDARASIDSARAAADSGHLDQATATLSQAAAREPTNPLIHLWLGRIAAAGDAHASAVEHFRRALFLERSLVAAELGLGQALLRIGRQEAGAQHLRRVLSLLSGDAPAALVPEMELCAESVRQLAELALATVGARDD